MKKHHKLTSQFISTLKCGDLICSHHFVIWVKKNHSIPIHPRKAAELLDSSKQTKKKRFTNSEKYKYWQETRRWVRVVWIVQEV